MREVILVLNDVLLFGEYLKCMVFGVFWVEQGSSVQKVITGKL